MIRRKEPPFKVIVDSRGYYTPEYKNWAIQRENFPHSGLANEAFVSGDANNYRRWNGIEYVFVMADTSKIKAVKNARKIRELGGLARITVQHPRRIYGKKKGTKLYVTWFNPNGSMAAFQWVSQW